VLDFGLAKALDPIASGSAVAEGPTLTASGTVMGSLLGTPAYMSPEQARGQPVDRRADIWAFGAILLELLTGRRAFGGETVSDVLASVLTSEPDFEALPGRTPAAVRRLIRRCLERDPRRRLRDIGDAWLILSEPPDGDERPAVTERSRVTGWVLSVLAVMVAVSLAWMLKPAPSLPQLRLTLAPPLAIEGPRVGPIIAPDGRSMAYAADGRLRVQGLDQLTARPVTGGEGAEFSAWSPDSRSLVFAVDTRLYRTAVGGDPILVGEMPLVLSAGGGGLCWTVRDTIVFATGDNNLFEIPVSGGTPNAILRPDGSKESDFHNPSALPGDRGILYVVHRVPQGLDTLEVLTGGQRRVLFQQEGGRMGHPVYAPSGHILVVRDDTATGIWALPFDLDALEVTGKMFLVSSTGSRPSVSRDGILLYSSSTEGGTHQPVLLDRHGTVVEEIGAPLQHADNASLSPQEDRLALCADEGSDTNLWLYDLERHSRNRLVFQAGCGARAGGVTWSEDGRVLMFASALSGNIEKVAIDAPGVRTKVVEGRQPALSRDGSLLVFSRESAQTLSDLWSLTLDGTSTPKPLVATPAREDFPQISPDGKMLAYVSDETGRAQVYMRSLGEEGGTWQVSTAGGEYPHWSRSGHRLYFLRNEDVLFEVEISHGPRVSVGAERELLHGGRARLGLSHGYDVFGDDARIATVRIGTTDKVAGDLTLVTNWTGP